MTIRPRPQPPGHQASCKRERELAAIYSHRRRQPRHRRGPPGERTRRPPRLGLPRAHRPHRRALLDGIADAVINQDAGHEIRSAVRLALARLGGERVVAAQERIRIDIFVKDNLP
jgi:LacI family transcriptional regulator